MLAARLLYPDAVVAVGTLNRNVRDFYRLHADELGAVVEAEPARARRDPAADRRRDDARVAARRARARRARSRRREGALRPPRRARAARTGSPRTPRSSRRTARSRRRSSGSSRSASSQPTPLEATAFALGIHEDTGSLTYATTTQRDVDALVVVPAPRCAPGSRRTSTSTRRSPPPSAASSSSCSTRSSRSSAAGEEVLLAAVDLAGVRRRASRTSRTRSSTSPTRARSCSSSRWTSASSPSSAAERERIDAAAIAAALGGGGHAQAASAISREALAEARERGARGARPTRSAEPVARATSCRRPPRAVEPGRRRVRDAMTLCQRHGQSGVFVVEDGRLVGGVSREDLDKAIGHEPLARARARDHEQPGRDVAREDASLAELRALVDGGRGRPRRGRARRRARRRRQPRRPPARARRASGREPSEVGASIADELRSSSRGSRRSSRRSRRSGERADGVYLVGGTVRDILLGEESFDVDIAVEGDAIAFAYALAEALGGRATPHQQVRHRDRLVRRRRARRRRHDAHRVLRRAGSAADRSSAPVCARISSGATSRSTRWRRRSAPTTSGGSSTRTAAARDLEARVLRVLHNLSFIDDPTRIFRGIRYEARYGFRFDEHSARLAARLHRDGARRRSLVVAAARRARARCSRIPARRAGSVGSASSAPTARSIRTSAATTRPRALFERALGAPRRARRRRPRLAHRDRRARARAELRRGVRLARAADACGDATPS